MCHSTENLYSYGVTNLLRVADDFYPREADSHPVHLQQVRRIAQQHPAVFRSLPVTRTYNHATPQLSPLISHTARSPPP